MVNGKGPGLNALSQQDDFCYDHGYNSYGCRISVSRDEARQILKQLRTDRLITIGVWMAFGTLPGVLFANIWIGAGSVALFGAIGTIINWEYEDAHQEIYAALEATPNETITLNIGRADNNSPVQLNATGYEPVNISDAVLQSIIRVTGTETPYLYSPYSTPMPTSVP